jgi:hypothetical protein
MSSLNSIINRISYLTGEVPQRLKNFSSSELSYKPAPGKWSKKEILGHLCDSAVNNLSRFIRAQFEPEPFKITPYSQNEWVDLNHYQEMDMKEILEYWILLNRRIGFIISKIPEHKLKAECDFSGNSYRPGNGDKSLQWFIEDYVVHMEHHLQQLGIMN